MFKFSPFNWFSSFLLSKFIAPYFKQIDENQINVGFWDGSIQLKNLELSRDFFLLLNAKLEVLHSEIKLLKLVIPWKSIKTQPVQLEISGVKLVVSNIFNQSQKEKEEIKEKSLKIKKHALEEFELSLKKASQNNPEHKSQKNGYFQNIFKGFLENFILQIKDVELIFIFHINSYEVVKIGAYMSDFIFRTPDANQIIEEGSLIKEISINNCQLYFDFYDSFFQTQNMDQLFKEDVLKPYASFINAAQNTSKKNKQDEQSNHYILKNFNISIFMKIDYLDELKVKVEIATNNLVLFFKQHQLRLLIKCIQSILQHKANTPEIRPGTDNGAIQWWKYLITKVLKEQKSLEQYQEKGLFEVQTYKYLYTKKKINEDLLKEQDKQFLYNFEVDNPFTQTIIVRQMALTKIEIMKKNLLNGEMAQKIVAKEWFRQFDKEFDLNQINSIHFKQSQKNTNFQISFSVLISGMELLIQESELLKDVKNLYLQISLFKAALQKLPKLQQRVLQHIKQNFLIDLQNKGAQQQQQQQQADGQEQQQQIIQDNNNSKNNNGSPSPAKKSDKNNDPHQISKSQINQDQNWNVSQLLNSKKLLLLHIKLKNVQMVYNQEQSTSKVLKLQLGHLTVRDMHKINTHYQTIFELEEGLKIMINSDTHQENKDSSENSTFQKQQQQKHQKIVHNHFDLKLGVINLTLCKPFIERLSNKFLLIQLLHRAQFLTKIKKLLACQNNANSIIFFLSKIIKSLFFLKSTVSLMQLVLLDADNIQQSNRHNEKYDRKAQYIFFNQFLVQKKVVTSLSNLSIVVRKINIYLPVNYQIKSEMFVVQVNTVKVFKQEHENNLVSDLRQEYNDNLLRTFDYNEGQDFRKKGSKQQQPLLISIQSLRIMEVESFFWERAENVFYQNLKKLHKIKKSHDFSQGLPQSQTKSVPFYYRKIPEKMQTLMETLPINLRIETTEKSYPIGKFVKSEFKISGHKMKKQIYPQTKTTFLNLPYLVINISIKQIYQLMYIIRMLSTSGYNLYNAVSQQSQMEGLDSLFNGGGSAAAVGGGGNSGVGGVSGYNINVGSGLEGLNDRGGLFFPSSQQQQQSLLRKQKFAVYQHIIYEPDFTTILQEIVLSHLFIQCEGIMVNLLVNTKECIEQKYGRGVDKKPYHSNELQSLFLEHLVLEVQNRFFQKKQKIAVGKLLLENRNCNNQHLKKNILNTSALMLARSDYFALIRRKKILKRELHRQRFLLRLQRQQQIAEGQNGINGEDNFGEQLLHALDQFSEIECENGIRRQQENYQQTKKQYSGSRERHQSQKEKGSRSQKDQKSHSKKAKLHDKNNHSKDDDNDAEFQSIPSERDSVINEKNNNQSDNKADFQRREINHNPNDEQVKKKQGEDGATQKDFMNNKAGPSFVGGGVERGSEQQQQFQQTGQQSGQQQPQNQQKQRKQCRMNPQFADQYKFLRQNARVFEGEIIVDDNIKNINSCGEKLCNLCYNTSTVESKHRLILNFQNQSSSSDAVQKSQMQSFFNDHLNSSTSSQNSMQTPGPVGSDLRRQNTNSSSQIHQNDGSDTPFSHKPTKHELNKPDNTPKIMRQTSVASNIGNQKRQSNIGSASKQCNTDTESNERDYINFNSQQQQQSATAMWSKSDVYIEMITTNDEYERALKKRRTANEVFINMRDFVMLVDAEMIKQLRIILDIGNLYVNQRISNFQEFMKIKGFWPDFMAEDQSGCVGGGGTSTHKQHQQYQQTTSSSEENLNEFPKDLHGIGGVGGGVNLESSKDATQATVKAAATATKTTHLNKLPLFKLTMQMSSLTLLCQHQLEVIYVINMKKVEMLNSKYNVYTLLQVEAQDLSVIDSAKRQGTHPEIIKNLDNNCKNRLSCEFKSFTDQNFIKIQKYSSYLGVRLSNVEIIFLKRNTKELQCYIRKFVLRNFQHQCTEIDKQFLQQISRCMALNCCCGGSSGGPTLAGNGVGGKDVGSHQNSEQYQPFFFNQSQDFANRNGHQQCYCCCYNLNNNESVEFMTNSQMAQSDDRLLQQHNNIQKKNNGNYPEETNVKGNGQQQQAQTINNQNLNKKGNIRIQINQGGEEEKLFDLNQLGEDQLEDEDFVTGSDSEHLLDGGENEDDGLQEGNNESQGKGDDGEKSAERSSADGDGGEGGSFQAQSVGGAGKKRSSTKHSTFRMEIVVLESMAKAYRNSLSNDGIFLQIKKAGVWTTGQWGMKYGDLFQTGQMSYERQIILEEQESEDGQSMASSAMYDIPNRNEQEFKNWQGKHDQQQQRETANEGSRFFSMDESQQFLDPDNAEYPELMRITLVEMRASVYESNQAKDLFIKAPNNVESLDLKIYFEDNKFQETEHITQERNPMKIDIYVPQLKVYFYDDEFNILVKFFQENLGEQAQTVQDPDFVWDIHNETIWMFLDIQCRIVVAKIFQGKRTDLDKYILNNKITPHRKEFLDDFNRKFYLFKNPASVGFTKIKNVNYKFYMRENGAKLMKLYVETINLKDFRQRSKLLVSRRVLFKGFKGQGQQQDDINQNIFKNPNDDVQVGGDMQNEDENIQGDQDDSLNSGELEIDEDFDKDILDQDENGQPRQQGQGQGLGSHHKSNNQENRGQTITNSTAIINVAQDHQRHLKESNQPQQQQQTHGKKTVQLPNNVIKEANENQEQSDHNIKDKQGEINNKDKKALNNSTQHPDKPVDKPKAENQDAAANKEQKNEQQSAPAATGEQNHKDNPEVAPSKKNRFKMCLIKFFKKMLCCKRKKGGGSSNSAQGQGQGQGQSGNNTGGSCIDNAQQHKQLTQQGGDPMDGRGNRQDDSCQSFDRARIMGDINTHAWPTDGYPFNRKTVIHRLKQALPITIPDDPDEYEHLKQEFKDSAFGQTSQKSQCDFVFVFTSRPDGEKLIKMQLENKSLILLIDFIMDIVQYFRKPFDGSDVQPNLKPPFYNNYPPMVVKIRAANICALLLGDYQLGSAGKSSSTTSTRQGQVLESVALLQQQLLQFQQQQQGNRFETVDEGLGVSTITGQPFSRNNSGLIMTQSTTYGNQQSQLQQKSLRDQLIVLNAAQSTPGAEKSENVGDGGQGGGRVGGTGGGGAKFNSGKKQKHQNSSLAVVFDAEYTHQWFGDNWKGPGCVKIGVDLKLKNTYFVKTQDYFHGHGEEPKEPEGRELKQCFNLLNNQLISFTMEYSLNFCRNHYSQYFNKYEPPSSSDDNDQFGDDAGEVNDEYKNDANCGHGILKNKALGAATQLNLDGGRGLSGGVQGHHHNEGQQLQQQIQPKQLQSSTGQGQNSYRTIVLKLINPSSNSKDYKNISISIQSVKQLNAIIKNIKTSTLEDPDPNEQQLQLTRNKPPPLPFTDYCISTLKLEIRQFKIEILKNNFGVKVIQASLKDCLLKRISKDSNSISCLKGRLSIEYFNKRKQVFEPIIEPWVFIVKYLVLNGNQDIQLKNFESDLDKKAMPFLRDHINSLNINLTTAFVETIMEGIRIFKDQIEDKEPCTLSNFCGYPLEIKDFLQGDRNINNNKQTVLKENMSLQIPTQTFSQVINLNILKREVLKEYEDETELYEQNKREKLNLNVNEIMNQKEDTEDLSSPQQLQQSTQQGFFFNKNITSSAVYFQQQQSQIDEVDFNKYGQGYEYQQRRKLSSGILKKGSNNNASQQISNKSARLVQQQSHYLSQGSSNGGGTIAGATLNSLSVPPGMSNDGNKRSQISTFSLMTPGGGGGVTGNGSGSGPTKSQTFINRIPETHSYTSIPLSSNQQSPMILHSNQLHLQIQSNQQQQQQLAMQGNLEIKEEQEENEEDMVSSSNPGQLLKSNLNQGINMAGTSSSQFFQQSQQKKEIKVQFNENKNAPVLKNASDYRLIKRIRMDQVGFQCFTLEPINPTQQSDLLQQASSQKRDTNFLMDNLKYLKQGIGKIGALGLGIISSKKINEEGKTYFMVDVQLDPMTGAKQVNISTSVKFFNAMHTAIEIGFLTSGQMTESFTHVIQPNESFPVPLEFLENRTEVRFKKHTEEEQYQLHFTGQPYLSRGAVMFGGSNSTPRQGLVGSGDTQSLQQYYHHQKKQLKMSYDEFQYYSLEQLIKDKTPINEFELDDDIVSETLGESGSGGQRFIYKQDQSVMTLKQHLRKINGQFHFVLSCVKSKRQLFSSYHDDRSEREWCYETSLIMYPLFKFTNATVRVCWLRFAITSSEENNYDFISQDVVAAAAAAVGQGQTTHANKKAQQQLIDRKLDAFRSGQANQFQIFPGEDFYCEQLKHSEDIALWVSFGGYKESKEIKIFLKKDRRGKLDVTLHKRDSKGSLLLYIDYIRRSQNNRDMVIYCPYLIYNETSFFMSYRERGLTSNINSVDIDNNNELEQQQQQQQMLLQQQYPEDTLKSLEEEDNRLKNPLRRTVTLMGDGSQQQQQTSKQTNFSKFKQNFANTNLISNNRQNDQQPELQILEQDEIDGGSKSQLQQQQQKRNKSYSKTTKEQMMMQMDDEMEDHQHCVGNCNNDKHRQKIKYSAELNRLHMFSTSRKMNKFQISLCRTAYTVWSKPISLQSSEGVVSLIEKQHIETMQSTAPTSSAATSVTVYKKKDPPGSKQKEIQLDPENQQGISGSGNANINSSFHHYNKAKSKITSRIDSNNQNAAGAEANTIVNSSGIVIAGNSNNNGTDSLQIMKLATTQQQQIGHHQMHKISAVSSLRRKLDFGIKIESCPGFYSRSKIIVITPRFILRNDSVHNNHIAVVQEETEYLEENIIRLKPKSSVHFFWRDKRKKDNVRMSFYDQSTGNIIGWSRPFKIDKICDFAVKLRKFKNKIHDNEYAFQKVSISLQDTVICVRIMDEDLENPPYCIENRTNYEILYRQSVISNKKYWCYKPKNQIPPLQMQPLNPRERMRFTWDEWVLVNDHILEVEIEGQMERYNIDVIQDYKPIILKGSREKKQRVNKKYLFKKGHLMVTDKPMDKPQDYYVMLDVFFQKLKMYDKDNRCETVSLKGAKIEESRELEFIVTKANNDLLYFKAASTAEAKEWIEFISLAILINTPEMVYFKIEPMNATKVLTFYSVHTSNEMQGAIGLNGEENDAAVQPLKSLTDTYNLTITNTIAISIIDNTPKEIIEISFKKVIFTVSKNDEWLPNDNLKKQDNIDQDDVQSSQLGNNNPAVHTLFISQQQQNQIGPSTAPTINFAQSQQAGITNTNTQNYRQNQSMSSMQAPNTSDKNLLNVQKYALTLTLDSLIINNQLLDTQFPVLLAPNKRKVEGDDQPFLQLQIQWKNSQSSSASSSGGNSENVGRSNASGGGGLNVTGQPISGKVEIKQEKEKEEKKSNAISYIHLLSFYVDTLELRIDDHILVFIDNFVQQINRTVMPSKLQGSSTTAITQINDNGTGNQIQNQTGMIASGIMATGGSNGGVGNGGQPAGQGQTQGQVQGQNLMLTINNNKQDPQYEAERLDQDQINNVGGGLGNSPDTQSNATGNQIKIYDFRIIEKKIEQSIEILNSQNSNARYIKNLKLEPMLICFTFRSSPGHSLTTSLKNFFGDLGLTLASIDQANISLNSLQITHIYGSMKEIFLRISKHYSKQFLTQLYKLFGSFDLLGNPVSLIENLGTGVLDMFYEPFYALVKGKGGYKFGEKFAKGAFSLIGHSISGVYKTVNKILGTIMKILASVTMDKKYIQERQNRLNRTIKNWREGVVIGLKNLMIIFGETIVGICRRPIQEAKLSENGLLGFFKGVFQGFISIIIKPTVGIYDFLITIIEGLKNSTKYEEHIMDARQRPPRIFGENKTLIPFEFTAAIGQDILRKYKAIDHEKILFYDELMLQPNKQRSQIAQLILTDIRLVYVNKHDSINYEKIKLHKIKSIVYNHRKRQFIFKAHVPIKSGVFKRRTSQVVLQYQDYDKAKILIQKLKEIETSNIGPIQINEIEKPFKLHNH